MTIDHTLGHRQRLKSRFIKAPKSLPDYEFLELVLFNAIPRKDVKPLAKKLITQFGNFAKVINSDDIKLKSFDNSITDAVIIQLEIIRESIARILLGRIKEDVIISGARALNDYLIATMSDLETEIFRIIYLNTKNHLIADEINEYGTIDQVHVYPREIVKRALFHGASAIILVHNHPSGIPKPSEADVIITKKIINACKTIDVDVHDHIIVGAHELFSFKANELM
ncbi:MAG: DNA repair protein RadC [Rickettsiaceae bacterium]|nr:DNA repair protein RadC [Rickettsiaceae bacterium]